MPCDAAAPCDAAPGELSSNLDLPAFPLAVCACNVRRQNNECHTLLLQHTVSPRSLWVQRLPPCLQWARAANKLSWCSSQTN